MFLYEKEINNKSHFGLICSISVEKELVHLIDCHETVYPERVNVLCNDLEQSLIQKTPILFLTQEKGFLTLISKLKNRSHFLKEITSSKGTIHRIWKTDELTSYFLLKGGAVLADGHHRYHAFLKLFAKKNSNRNLSLSAAIFHVQDVKTKRKGLLLNSYHIAPTCLLEKLKKFTDIREGKKGGDISAFINHTWYQTPFFQHMRSDDLDSEHFRRLILQDIPPNNIELYPEAEVNLELDIPKRTLCGFIFPPDPPIKIFNLARKGKMLGPNSTFFEPKFISGLIPHVICDP